MSGRRPEDLAPPPARRVGLWIGLGLGILPMVHGIRGVLADLPGVQLTSFLRWFLGAAVVHDLVVGPAVCAVGWVVATRLPRVAVGPVQGALVAGGATALVAYPFVRGFGVTPGEPSFLSRDYAASVLILWAAYAAIAAVVVAARLRRGARRSRS